MIRSIIDGTIALLLLPVILVTGLLFAIGYACGKAWEAQAEARGKRSTWKG